MTHTQPTPAARGTAPDQAEEFDPYALTADVVEEPPRSTWRTLRQIGPGLILAGSIVGSGELIATTNLGAKVGFVLLWLVIVSCFIKVFVQAELGRYAISSGETTLAAFRRVPGPGVLFGWWWLAMMLFTQFQLGAMVGGVGYAGHMVFPGVSPWLAQTFGGAHGGVGGYITGRPEVPWAVLTAVVTSAILAAGSYGLVERVSTVLVVTFTLMTVLCVVLLPAAGHPIDWGEVAGGLKFSLPAGATGHALAMFGITGVGAAELVAYPYWCIEKGYARKAGRREESETWLRRARGWLRVMMLDTWFCMGVYTLATIAFYFLGAAVLHSQTDGKGLPAKVGDVLNMLASMYVPVLGERGAVVFIVGGAMAVLYSTLYSATAANSRALADFVRVNRLATFRTPEDRTRWVRLFCVVFPLIDLLLFLAVGQPVKMVMIGGIAQALTLPMITVTAIWLRYRHTDQRLAPGRVWDAFLWLSLAGLCAAAMYGLWDSVAKGMGWK